MPRLDTLVALRDALHGDKHLCKCLHSVLRDAREDNISSPSRYVEEVIDEVAYHLWKCGQDAAKEG